MHDDVRKAGAAGTRAWPAPASAGGKISGSPWRAAPATASRTGSREDELLVPPVPQRDGGRRASIPDPHRRRERRLGVAAEVHLLPGRREPRRAVLLDLDLHLPEPLPHRPGAIPEWARPAAPLP